MKKNKILKYIFTTAFIGMSFVLFGQQDSIAIEDVDYKLEKIEGFQSNVKESLGNEFKRLESKIDDDYTLLKTLAGIGIGLNLLFIGGVYFKAKKYVDSELKKKFDKIITQRESDILDVVNNNDVEKQILKNKKILVLTSKEGDDKFLRKFFKTMGFSLDNIDYQKVNSYEDHFGKYDLVFANDEDESLGVNLTQEYFEQSPNDSVLFYFGKSYKRGTKEANRINFANSRTQIYGNLINLLKYQDLID
ncbi:NARF domain-containing protein [Olleya namhaensis]|uniref:NARF domain-containing protein n=1 Tax=Olleya namhaensis TaxID=1144750 RepID=UPI00248FFE7C|nr:NARF domain-containing protein [Olleya namhaensis]